MDYMAQITDIVAQVAARRGALISHSEALARAFNETQTPHHRILAQMANVMQRDQRLCADLTSPLAGCEELTRQLSKINSTMDMITAPCRAVQEAMRSQSTAMQSLTSKVTSTAARQLSVAQFSQPALAWSIASSGLTNRMQEIGLLVQRQSLAARLLETPRVYASFMERTTDRLLSEDSSRAAELLRGSMYLAEDQLLGIACTLDTILVIPDDTESPGLPRELNAPYIQQEELLSLDGSVDVTSDVAIAENVPSVNVVRLSQRVLTLVADCNEASRTSAARSEIFKPTTKLLAVYADLPWMIPRNKAMFGDFVDCLYFLFYEGAGKDHLRFLDTHGGPLTEADCDLIWCIKHLRNKWLRHDADHGSEGGVRKSWAELVTKFRWLGLAQFPSSAEQFQELHRKLLELALEFLEAILSKLRLG